MHAETPGGARPRPDEPTAWWGEGRAAVRDAARAVLHAGGADAAPMVEDDDRPIGPPWTVRRRMRDLQATVRAYVGHRREEGAAVERVLPEVGVLVVEAQAEQDGSGVRAVATLVAPALAGAGRAAPAEPADALLAQVMRWSLEAYYDEPALASVPRFY